MNLYEELGRALTEMVHSKTGATIIPAKVLMVDEHNRLADVRDVVDNDLFDVRLRATSDGHGQALLLPAVNSWVLIGRMGLNSEEWAVLMVSEVQKVLFEVGATKLEVDDQGTLIQRGSENLRSLLTDLLSALETLTVTCAAPGLPSSPPINLASFTNLKTRVNNLLN